MANARDGVNYHPPIKPQPVVKRGEFLFAASHFDHGHIYGQVRGLEAAGGVCKAIYEPRDKKVEPLKDLIDSGTRVVSRFEEILEDDEIALVTSAAIPDQRCDIGVSVMEAGKDYFTDKAPLTTFEQLSLARAACRRTGKKYAVCYSERVSNESAWHAGELIADGAIGRVLQVMSLAPHNLAPETRPDWFFQKKRHGGILIDIGSHQFEQFLTFAGASSATVNFARVDNLANAEYPELEDFGEASLTLDNDVSAYCRLDWFNPKGSRTWGDGRVFVLGEKGYIELRKYVDIGRDGPGNKIYLVDHIGEHVIECDGKVGFPFFGKLILDVLQRTENAMTQEHAFRVAELSLQAQAVADARRTAL